MVSTDAGQLVLAVASMVGRTGQDVVLATPDRLSGDLEALSRQLAREAPQVMPLMRLLGETIVSQQARIETLEERLSMLELAAGDRLGSAGRGVGDVEDHPSRRR